MPVNVEATPVLDEAEIEADIDARMRDQEARVADLEAQPGIDSVNERNSAVAVGDSWFDYPLAGAFGIGQTDVIAQLELKYDHKKPILRLAHYGDATLDMMSPVKQERLIRALTNKNLWVGGKPNAIFCSAGGNDVAGTHFKDYLRKNQGQPASAGLDEDAFALLLDRVQSNYEILLGIRDEYAPGVRIIGHAYDFPIPDNRAIKILTCQVGPWLWPSLLDRGWSEADGTIIIRNALTRFRRMLKEKFASSPQKRFDLVPTQGSLTDSDYKNDWSNELHPTSRGFKAIANKFDAVWRGHALMNDNGDDPQLV